MLHSSLGSTPFALRSFEGLLDREKLKSAFAEDGFLILRQVVSSDELKTVEQRLTSEFRSWRDGSDSFRGGGLMSGHLNCYPGPLARGVFDQLRDKGVFELGQALLPTNPKSVKIGCNFNLPGSVEQHYHVDGAFLAAFLIVNVAVVDTDLANGAIDLIPRSHKRFYKYWEFATKRLYRGSTRVELSRGDVLMRPSTLWHRGMPNRTQTARPMLAVTLGESHISTDDPFQAPGVEFQANWFRTNLLGRLRERTTVAAPFTYSAYRFARSLLGNKGYATF